MIIAFYHYLCFDVASFLYVSNGLYVIFLFLFFHFLFGGRRVGRSPYLHKETVHHFPGTPRDPPKMKSCHFLGPAQKLHNKFNTGTL